MGEKGYRRLKLFKVTSFSDMVNGMKILENTGTDMYIDHFGASEISVYARFTSIFSFDFLGQN